MIGVEPPSMRGDIETEAIEQLCDSLAGRVSWIAAAVERRVAWPEIETGLIEARKALEDLGEAYNDFERSVERRYAAEIAAAEES